MVLDESKKCQIKMKAYAHILRNLKSVFAHLMSVFKNKRVFSYFYISEPEYFAQNCSPAQSSYRARVSLFVVFQVLKPFKALINLTGEIPVNQCCMTVYLRYSLWCSKWFCFIKKKLLYLTVMHIFFPLPQSVLLEIVTLVNLLLWNPQSWQYNKVILSLCN